MTINEFEKLKLLILGEQFPGTCSDPITYGMERAAFEVQKFQKLLDAAQEVDIPTVRSRMPAWKRQMEKARQSQTRFERMREVMNPKLPASSCLIKPCKAATKEGT